MYFVWGHRHVPPGPLGSGSSRSKACAPGLQTKQAAPGTSRGGLCRREYPTKPYFSRRPPGGAHVFCVGPSGVNSGKTVSGHVKKKKNASVKISETSRAAHLYVPPAPCHVPSRALQIRRRYAAPKSAGPANLYVEKSPPIFSNSVLWTLLQGQ